MNNNNLLTGHDDDASLAPAWLIQTLELAGEYAAFTSDRHAPVSEAFRARARAAVLNQLHSERERFGFVALPFGKYVEGLATALGLSLAPVLQWLKIPDIHQPAQHSARGFAHLGLEIGLGLTEILIHLRIAIADIAGYSPGQMLMARYRGGASALTNLRKCVAILEEIEAEYDRSTLEELRLIETEIMDVYHNHTTPDPA